MWNSKQGRGARGEGQLQERGKRPKCRHASSNCAAVSPRGKCKGFCSGLSSSQWKGACACARMLAHKDPDRPSIQFTCSVATLGRASTNQHVLYSSENPMTIGRKHSEFPCNDNEVWLDRRFFTSP